ncbi:hypothetical protein [Pseudomonas grimontii]|uniref:hypothetical protein n=1 Tax=Pseudomonas grimontii TaxID=129847 RepID=UPI00387AD1D8
MGIDTQRFERLYKEVDDRVEAHILTMAIQAKKSLGLDWKKEFDLLAALKPKLRTFVRYLHVQGIIIKPMFDEYSISYASYDTDGFNVASLKPCSLAQAKELVNLKFVETIWAEVAEDFERERLGGITRFKLLDCNRQPVLLGHLVGEQVCWEDYSTLTPADLDTLRLEVERLRDEASEESRGDNHNSSQRLINRANKIRDQIEAAVAVHRLTNFKIV